MSLMMQPSRLGFCAILAIGLILVSLTGCDAKPVKPDVDFGLGKNVIPVDPSDAGEVEAVTRFEVARVNYLYRLQVLEEYYLRTGQGDKLNWTRQEIRNLQEATTVTWAGIPTIVPPSGENVARADERALVELVVQARQEYLQAREQLLEFYQAQDQTLRANIVRNMAARFDPIHTYRYFMEAEVAPANLEPTEVIPQADELYRRALELHQSGKGLLRTFLTTDYDKQRKALELFQRLINRYPNSTKIPLAAYYIGEIYKEYFDENLRAVHWYQRAWQWDPNIAKPARFQAAVVHDLRLENTERAVELYQDVIEQERLSPSNVAFARNRIVQLTGQQQ